MFEKQPFGKNMTMFLVVLIGLAVIIWLLSPGTTVDLPLGQPYRFVPESMESVGPEESPQEEAVNGVANDQPHVNPETGVIMDGPGFEKGEDEGINSGTFSSIPSNYYFLDDGAGASMTLHHNLCSKSCCSSSWPTPFKQKYDPYVCSNKDEFVGSRYFCNNTFGDSGCLCLTKKQAQHLYTRGGNGREFF